MIRGLIQGLFLTGLLLAGSVLAQTEGIQVSGTGTVYGAPDMATFSVGINSLNADVTVATEEANAAAEQLITALREAGVAEADLRTSNFNVFREDWHTDEDGAPAEPLYRVINTLNVTVRDISQVGELMSIAVAAGANQLDSLQFTIADAAGLESEARALALNDAGERAAELADLAGVTLGSPVLIQELGVGNLPVARQPYAMAAAESAAVPIETGELSVSVELVVVYGIVTD